jgi:hypothetical protein
MEDSDFDYEHLESVVRHIRLVQDACLLLGKRLIRSGEEKFGLNPIANGFKHDQSKFHGIEWKYLTRESAAGGGHEEHEGQKREKEMFFHALNSHQNSNEHHPEYWQDISDMPRIFLAEFVCDTFARSTEMGTDLRKWIKEEASKKYGFSLHGKTYKQIKYFLDMLLDPTFKPIKRVKED